MSEADRIGISIKVLYQLEFKEMINLDKTNAFKNCG